MPHAICLLTSASFKISSGTSAKQRNLMNSISRGIVSLLLALTNTSDVGWPTDDR